MSGIEKDRGLTPSEEKILSLIGQADDILEEIASLRRKRQLLLQEAHHLGKVRGLKVVSYNEARNVQVISIRLLRQYVSDHLLDKCSHGHWTPDIYVVERRVLARVVTRVPK